MVALGGHLGGVTALEYQHEDKLLAVARWVLLLPAAACCLPHELAVLAQLQWPLLSRCRRNTARGPAV